ncbi:MAG: helix-turn-helix transcriptional regulator [Romboutsia timonensis]|uniref:helix-turn-helix domain-containing protein n=1 Tax=Romboutsia timonensis TaxID=1776391 RepID=UPI002A762FE8|nr:helix-turn-helix transcriptional regulator [Romboutsia timonensis]MDY3000279.1 helix-turn-helix transcriptional regulator [Romboutsia timonensis]
MITKELIGERIKQYREAKEITQQRMVDELKDKGFVISRETLSKIENGNRSVSAVELSKICDVLGVKIEDILDDKDDDLVTLFRKKKNVTEETLYEIEEVQNIIISFINQKNIVKKGNFKKSAPLWKE